MLENSATFREDKGLVVLLTGGAGFLGRAIIHEFTKAENNHFPHLGEIRVLDQKAIQDSSLTKLVSITGDIRSYADVLTACHGVDLVIHAASLVDWGFASEELLYDINVKGTENVIKACQEKGVPGLVYTSTMDVVYAKRPISNGDENTPYPERFADGYARTKATAEQLVVRANGTKRNPGKSEALSDPRLLTCVIRPCGLYGEGDPYHITETLRLLMKGKLPFRIGNGNAVFQHAYVGNVAHAHVLAARDLLGPDPISAGEIYIITDTAAENFFDFLDPIMTSLGYPLPPKNRSIPFWIMYALGTMVEFAANLCRPVYKFQPAITRSSVRIVCQDFSFVGHKAVRDLGYQPIYSKEESFQRTVDYFRIHGPVTRPLQGSHAGSIEECLERHNDESG